MPVPSAAAVAARLAALRIELIELACRLERQGRLDAADVALATSGRIAEFNAELEAADRTGHGPLMSALIRPARPRAVHG